MLPCTSEDIGYIYFRGYCFHVPQRSLPQCTSEVINPMYCRGHYLHVPQRSLPPYTSEIITFMNLRGHCPMYRRGHYLHVPQRSSPPCTSEVITSMYIRGHCLHVPQMSLPLWYLEVIAYCTHIGHNCLHVSNGIHCIRVHQKLLPPCASKAHSSNHISGHCIHIHQKPLYMASEAIATVSSSESITSKYNKGHWQLHPCPSDDISVKCNHHRPFPCPWPLPLSHHLCYVKSSVYVNINNEVHVHGSNDLAVNPGPNFIELQKHKK